jgi:hypothetical protein
MLPLETHATESSKERLESSGFMFNNFAAIKASGSGLAFVTSFHLQLIK